MNKHGHEATKSVGIWIRVSTEDQVKGESPEVHERRCRLYAESKGWTVREVYRLDAISGKSVMDRPETQRMLEDIRAGRISGLIFSKLARLARNTRELLEFSDIFRSQDADLISLQESIDTSTPAGRLFYTMIAALAQWEREEIASRVAASVPIRAKMGKSLGGAPPFGYHRIGGAVVPHPEEASVRRRMYELFLENPKTKVVARLLNEAGHRTRSGAKFTHPTVKRLLLDPTAKGVHRVNYTRERKDGKGVELKPKEEWVINQVEPIVSEETWDQAQAVLVHRKRNTRPGRPAIHTFAGLTFCHCGEKMRVPSNTPKYVCPACRNKIPIVDLEGIFHEQLRAFFLSPGEIAKHLGDADENIKTKEGLLAPLETELRRVSQDMEKTYRLYLADEISKDGFGRVYRPLEERRKQIEDELPRLQAEIDFLKIQYLSRDEILAQAGDLYTRWPELAPEDRRKIAEAIVERIDVGDGEIEIRLAYSGSGPSGQDPSGSSSKGPKGSPKLMAQREQNQLVAFPLCQVRMKSLKVPEPQWLADPQTIGQRLRKRRHELHLLQKDVAAQLGVHENTYGEWEGDRHEPHPLYAKGIAQFLGVAPSETGESFGEQIRKRRLEMGLTQRVLGQRLGVNRLTLSAWERGVALPTRRTHLERVSGFLGR